MTGKSPLNVRPRGKQIDFIAGLIKEHGSAQAALSACIDMAMMGAGSAKPTPEPRPSKPLPGAPASLEALLEPVAKDLERVMRKRSLDRIHAVHHSIRYAAENDLVW